MVKKKYKIIGKEDFGTWIRRGVVVEKTESWALFACDKGYAELLEGEATKIKGLTLLKKYGFPPYKNCYGRKQVLELISKIEEGSLSKLDTR